MLTISDDMDVNAMLVAAVRDSRCWGCNALREIFLQVQDVDQRQRLRFHSCSGLPMHQVWQPWQSAWVVTHEELCQ